MKKFIRCALIAAIGIVVSASSYAHTDNESRKKNCETAGGQVSNNSSTSFTCALPGDTGRASVICVEGQQCKCTGSACDEFGGDWAIERVAGNRYKLRRDLRGNAKLAPVAR